MIYCCLANCSLVACDIRFGNQLFVFDRALNNLSSIEIHEETKPVISELKTGCHKSENCTATSYNINLFRLRSSQ